ncbi:MAG: hypothetical protein IKM38_01090 [Christensenellaceae bacterium]|nr:hypothetical protein [Christensenellaceae bacterium]
MTTEMTNKLSSILADEVFNKRVKKLETAEELQAAFAERGLDLSIEEVHEICSQIAGGEESEMDDDALEAVNGGGILTTIAVYGTVVAVGYGVGWVAGKVFKKKTGICY